MVTESRRVIIHVKTSKVDSARLGENANADMLHNKRRIGAFLKGGTIGRGLTPEEEKKYLPEFLGISPTSPDWGKATRDYWANISVEVPLGIGYPLEVGFNYPNKEAAAKGLEEEKAQNKLVTSALAEGRDYHPTFSVRTEVGSPINLIEFILYRHCLLNAAVANHVDFIHASERISHYLFSTEIQEAQSKAKLESRQKAYAFYLELLNDNNKAQSMLVILRPYINAYNEKNPDNSFNIATAIGRSAGLEYVAREQPAVFIQTYQDPNLILKAFVERAIDSLVLRRVPNTEIIYYNDTLVGNTLDETLSFLKAEKNREVLLQIKSKVSEFGAGPVSGQPATPAEVGSDEEVETEV